MSGRGNFRPMPDDFAAHANEPIEQLIRRYRSSQETVTRWKMLAGTWRPRERPVIRTDWEGNEKLFYSVTEAARHTVRGRATEICNAIRRGGSHAGYYWRYAEIF